MSYVYRVTRPSLYGPLKVCDFDIAMMGDRREICYALSMLHTILTKTFGCIDIELGGDQQHGWYLYSMAQPHITLGYVEYDCVRYTPTADPFADFPNITITTTAKKVLSDRCPKCDVAGKFGARATLLCPLCNHVIGGLG